MSTIHFDLPKQRSSIIKVIGVGGGGSNAVNFMYGQEVEGVDFIVCNTDAKALEQSTVPNKIQLGPYLTQGLGAGANPEVGKKATEESLEEIRKILEVNTKMAFITVGMGGGTGTGGAPIIAEVCKSLGILTVGIVTTPFGFEGPRRHALAEEGINNLKPHVDTLLVISNDKLRMQFGNLKMKEAFGKADNVLATAAKCITDIINSKGQINVDFADVCTVMRSGGVAILGKAEAEGEARAQVVIEEALTSPLLNDNEIKGARWVLLNINSTEGDDEATMDEIDAISTHLQREAGEKTDIILGVGYDNTLGKKISITLIATGFDSKNPFAKPSVDKKSANGNDKILLTLKVDGNNQQQQPLHNPSNSSSDDLGALAPRMHGSNEVGSPAQSPFIVRDNSGAPTIFPQQELYTNDTPLYFELSTDITDLSGNNPMLDDEKKSKGILVDEALNFVFSETPVSHPTGIVSKPSNIYSDANFNHKPASDANETNPYSSNNGNVSRPNVDLSNSGLNDANKSIPPTNAANEPSFSSSTFGGNEFIDAAAEEQRRKIKERIDKLRNLNYDVNSKDDLNEVPAYVRQKISLTGLNNLEPQDYYSNYSVNKEDHHKKGEISSLNTFLDGKKPD